MTNTKTNKVRKTNRKFITTLCAVAAAMAIVTGITVCSASASYKEKASSRLQTASQAVTTRAADSAQATTYTNDQNAVQTQAAQQDANGYNYTYDQSAAESYAQQTQTAPQETAAPAAEDGKLYIPEGEVNDWKIHNAKDGFPIGSYINGQNTLYVEKLDNANYAITVTIRTGENTANVYSISAVANGSKMYYSNAVKSAVVYGEDGSIISSEITDNNHSGTFDASDAGYTWVDTEGTTIFVPWLGF